MLTLRPSRGMTLIELMVGLTITAFLLLAGAPSLTAWIRNTQIRSAAESIMTGLHHARTEAVQRNSSTRFQLTSTLDNTCTVSSSGQNWVINVGSGTTPAGSCAKQPSDTVPPLIVQKSVASNSSGITIAASQGGVVSFNGLGQQTPSTAPTAAIGTMTIDVSPTSGDCLSTNGTGTYRCLRIVVSPGGQARMCDPAMGTTSNSNQPTAC
jgi:type IV fimbrial biogenesis protein FimT